MAYRWRLRSGSKKEICPSCGKPRFVPYVSTLDGSTIALDENGQMIYGRCDREQNCGYHVKPNAKTKADGITPAPPKPADPPLRFYPSAVKVDTLTNLFYYACGLIGTANAIKAWQRYKVGRDGKRTIFWQIDTKGEIRAGKSIPYLENGHRDKSDKYPANWLHKCKAWDLYHTGKELQQCYFGAHLLPLYPGATIAIVESEKTALLLSAYTDPARLLWLASGGSQGLKNEDKNKDLQGREIWLLPDHGQFWNWNDTATKNGWRCFSTIEENPLFDGCDILDMVEAGVFGADLLYKAKK